MGPGWWQASDGRWYPPTPVQQPPVYRPSFSQKPPTPVAHSVATGCLVGTLILLGVLAALMLLGLALGPK
jgi:hypothetical protein